PELMYGGSQARQVARAGLTGAGQAGAALRGVKSESKSAAKRSDKSACRMRATRSTTRGVLLEIWPLRASHGRVSSKAFLVLRARVLLIRHCHASIVHNRAASRQPPNRVRLR